MPSPFGPSVRRALSVLIVALAAVALLPVAAHAAQPASLRLLGSDPEYRAVHLTTPTGQRVTAAPGLFRLRITPAGGPAVERRGFCADAHHAINGGTDYSVSLRTAADEPLLASARYGEAAWLVQQAETLVAAAPAATRALEAGAIQVAVWQLTDQIRESAPTDDAALNTRAAAIRALAAGRAVGGPGHDLQRRRAGMRRPQRRAPAPHRAPRQHRHPDRRGRRRRQPGAGALRRHRRRGRRGHVAGRRHGHRPRARGRRHPHPGGPRERGRDHPPGDDLPDAGRATRPRPPSPSTTAR